MDGQVRRARIRFNEAIAKRDIQSMTGVLVSGYHVVAGRSSQSHGVEPMMSRWRANFAADTLYGCVRNTQRVQVNEAWALAHEAGRWSCTYAGIPAGATPGTASGVYDAKWQRDAAGVWRLHAETFTTLRCDSAATACALPDPMIPAPAGSIRLTGDGERGVRDARAWYNDAIARGDAGGIAQLLAPGYHAIHGRGTHVEDTEAALEDWRNEFRTNGNGSCTRTSTEVYANGDWRIAHERGTWRCRSLVQGNSVNANGVYVAKWQRDTSGAWRVHTEVFTALHCEGSAAGCRGPEPVPAIR